MQRATWTDERLDEVGQRIDRRFDEIDRRFDHVEDGIRQLTATLAWATGGILVAFLGVIGAVAMNGGV